MTVETPLELTAEEREIVALGASIGAGCHPCVRHHVDAGRKAGVDPSELLATVVRAERVASVAANRLSRATRGLLGFDEYATAPDASRRASELASLGAAVASNSMADIEAHLAAGGDEGLAHSQLAQAVAIAQEVLANAGRIHARKAARLLGFDAEVEARAPGQVGEPSVGSVSGGEKDGCGCGAADEAPARVETDGAAAGGVAQMARSTTSVASGRTPKAASFGTPTAGSCGDECGCHDAEDGQPTHAAEGPAPFGADDAEPQPASTLESAAGDCGANAPDWSAMMARMGVNPRSMASCCDKASLSSEDER